jgi:heme-degrading monooxygenase HmoA
MNTRRTKNSYVIVWRYRVRRGAEARFERIYGARGAWARLFRKSRGYLGTQLFREVGAAASRNTRRGAGRAKKRPLAGARYVTIDTWRSRAAFDAFHRRHRGEYQRVDRQCAPLTLHEERLGAWTL